VIKAEFSALLLQSSVSRDPSEITVIYGFYAIIIIIFFSGFFDKYKFQKNSTDMKMSLKMNILNVFTVTFDRFNSSLMNKSIYFIYLFPPENKIKVLTTDPKL